VIDPTDLDDGRPWALASLRIVSETLSGEGISELLGIRPTSGRVSEGDPAFTVWMLDSGLDSNAAIEDHLYILVERLHDRENAIRQLVETATVEIWLSLSPGTRRRPAVLNHEVLTAVGSLGIDLVLDPYAPKARRT
jgi:hypothetical protein